MKVEAGMNLTVDVLEWREDWEFDHPTLVLAPVLRYSPNGESSEGMAESLGIDACLDGEIKSEDVAREFEWREWSLARLRRVFAQAYSGKQFPKKCYRAARWRLKFFNEESGELAFTMEQVSNDKKGR